MQFYWFTVNIYISQTCLDFIGTPFYRSGGRMKFRYVACHRFFFCADMARALADFRAPKKKLAPMTQWRGLE